MGPTYKHTVTNAKGEPVTVLTNIKGLLDDCKTEADCYIATQRFKSMRRGPL